MVVTFGRSGSWLDDQTAAENITSSNAGSKTRAHRVGRLGPAEPGLGDLGVRRLHGRVLDELERGELVLVLLGGGDGVPVMSLAVSRGAKVAGNWQNVSRDVFEVRRAPGPRCARSRCGTSSPHGFEAASVTAIAVEVGVTERTFYRHFATKDEVLFDDVGEAFDVVQHGAARAAGRRGPDPVGARLARVGADRPAAAGRDRTAALRAAQPGADRAGLPRPAGGDGARGARPARRSRGAATSTRPSGPSWSPARSSRRCRCGPRLLPRTTSPGSASSPARRWSRSGPPSEATARTRRTARGSSPRPGRRSPARSRVGRSRAAGAPASRASPPRPRR